MGPVCVVEGCSKYADHSHHIWRRSFLAGDFSWVELWDHTIVGNLMGLCWQHHEDVTQGKAWIRWLEDEKVFVYSDNTLTFRREIFPQPPQHGKPHPVSQERQPIGPAGQEICPGCHRPVKRAPVPGEKKEQARRRKTWTVTVPDDGEDGALVLDTLLDGCRDLFAHDDNKATRYFTLVQALALVVQHGHLLVSDK